jgi:NAD-dependent deacetylase
MQRYLFPDKIVYIWQNKSSRISPSFNRTISLNTMKKKLVISTGAGMSAESGISTFRDAGGLWEQYPVMDVASADGFERNPALVHQFYNQRRHDLLKAQPNAGHRGLVDLEQLFDVTVITQNVDDLHERAGSSHVIHLHGELMKIRSLRHPERIYQLDAQHLDTDINTRDKYGDPVRPHIVFFQEAVPMMEPAAEIASEADIFVVIGTSLNVYPAASLMHYVRPGVPIYYIDPRPAPVAQNVTVLSMTATEGVAKLKELLSPLA